MVTKSELTSQWVATAVSKVLSDPRSSKSAKSAAGSALTQRLPPSKATSPDVAAAVAKVLANKRFSKSSKVAAGSDLTASVGLTPSGVSILAPGFKYNDGDGVG